MYARRPGATQAGGIYLDKKRHPNPNISVAVLFPVPVPIAIAFTAAVSISFFFPPFALPVPVRVFFPLCLYKCLRRKILFGHWGYVWDWAHSTYTDKPFQ